MTFFSQLQLANLLDNYQMISGEKSVSLFRSLGTVADRLGLECYVVGGFVRDIFLKCPSKDIDIVVVGSGIIMAEAFAAELGEGTRISVFRNFGTAQVKWKGVEFEFVGARKESYTHDSRKPICEDGTLADDQNRRDFTINAMAICLNKNRFGELIDPFEGKLDLQDGIIATPLDPDITFSDDPLRMMRCVRFATRLRFVIEEDTLKALSRNRERIRIVSNERIIDELNKIIMTDQPSRGFVELQRCGLLEIILPELSALDIVETRNGRSHKNNFYHTLEVLDNVASRSKKLFLRWAALLHDIGKPQSKRWELPAGWTFHNHNYLGAKKIPDIFRRMKLPMDERMKYVRKLVNLHMRPIAIADDGVTDSAVRRLLFEAGNDIDDLMLLCEADITTGNETRKKGFLNNFRIVRSKLVEIEKKDRIRNFQPPINGEQIMQLFALPPGREVGALKSSLKDAILDGIIPNEYEAALTYIQEKAHRMGFKSISKQT